MSVLFDREAERALLGSVLKDRGLVAVLGAIDGGLRAHHFHLPFHQDVFAAMISLADRESGVDPVTVVAEMERLGRLSEPSQMVHELPQYAGASGDLVAYSARIVDLARWRHAQVCVMNMRASVEDQDREGLSKAAADLEAGARERRKDSLGPEQFARVVREFLEEGAGLPDWVVPLPFNALNDALAGGLWPGEVMTVSGATSNGKSIFVDQLLDFASDRGVTAHCYMTEMTALQRGLRYLSRRTGVAFSALRRRSISEREKQAALKELDRLRWGVSVAADWTVDDVVSDALRARYQLVVVDLIHGFHYHDERELDRYSKAMQRLARVSTTIEGHPGAVVVPVAHLQHGAPDRPTHDHIKGSASVKQDTDFALFVRLKQRAQKSPTGMATVPGEIYITKGRGGEKANLDVVLNPRRFRFELDGDQPVSVPAVAGITW